MNQTRPEVSFRFRAISALLLTLPMLLLSLTSAGWAQAAATITGTVTDSSGSAVSDATVTVTNSETSATREVTTDNSGAYRVLALPVGIYEVKVHKEGFEDAIWSGIRLNVGQAKVENMQLALSAAVQQVTVTATVQAPVVNTTTSQTSGLVTEKEIKDLPLNGRGFDKLITLNPGTTDFTTTRSANTTTSNGSAFSIDGQRPGDNEFLLNGVELTGSSQLLNSPGGVSGSLLGVDAIREFNVLTGTYGAEYGKREGGQVLVVTQSGGNEVHGSVYEFIRHDALNAPNHFDQGSALPFLRNQFGGAMGGPLKKDRLFLFGNYEGFRQSCQGSCNYQGPGGPVIFFVPDAAARAKTVAGMQKYLTMFATPGPNDTDYAAAGIARTSRTPEQNINEDFGTARLDYILGARDTLSGSYTIDSGNALNWQAADPLFGSSLTVTTHTFSLQETHVLSPQVVNTAIFGFARSSFANDPVISQEFLNNLNAYNLANSTSLTPNDLSLVDSRGPGGISIGGVGSTTGPSLLSTGSNNASDVWNHRNLFTYTDNMQVSKGRHQISFGVWFQRLQDNENTASRQLGLASFTSLAAFESGTLSSLQLVPQATELGWRTFMGAWYVQDAIKVHRNVMLSLGLRHEFDTGWNEVQGRASNYGVDANGVMVSPCLFPAADYHNGCVPIGSSPFTRNNAKALLGPRVSLAWDVFGNGSTAVRAGFGIHYSMLDALAFQLNSNPPFNGSISLTGNLTNPNLVPFNLSNSIPQQCGTTGAPTSPNCTKYSPQGVQQNLKIPTLEKWDLSVEQRLTNTTVLRIGYVGSFGFHQLISLDPNTVVPAFCPPHTTCSAGGVQASGQPATASSFTTGNTGVTYIPSVTTPPCNALGKTGCRPNPFLSSGFFWYSEGNTSYNALQIDLIKRYSQNLQFRANYTFSKDLDINSAPTGAQANNEAQMVLDRFDLRKDWGRSALNPTHAAHFSATYDLPFGHGQRWGANAMGTADKFVSGWQLNAIATIQSGLPFTPLVGSNVSGTGDTRNPDRPSFAPGFNNGNVVTGNPNQWFNPNAFAVPTAGTFGNVGRNSFTGPGLGELDLSLFKDTAVTERVKLEIRTECFNVLNRANFGTPQLIVFSNPQGAISPTAGQITYTATPARQVQFGVKVMY